MKTGMLLQVVLVLVLALPLATTAQERGLSQLQRGVIDSVMQDDGYIIISGQRYRYSDAEIEIRYRGEPLPGSFLSAGQSIEFRTGSDGSVRDIVVTAPDRGLDEVNAQ